MKRLPTSLNVLPCLFVFALFTTAPLSARGIRGLQSNHGVYVGSGWNLISLPASVSNGDKDTLFPSAVSPAYIFNNTTGYQIRDTLQNGVGFWLKFTSPDTVFIQGETVFSDTIEVQAGWNIIGSLSVSTVADSIRTEPPGIIASQFYRYVPGTGYQQADTLYPGLGYWVKINLDGLVVLSSGTGRPCPGMPTVFYAGKTYNTVQIGSQCWLRENLDVGSMIQGNQNASNNSVIEKYCYNDSTANCDTYGGLYQWNEAMQYDTTPGIQGICPPGWHVPTLVEFQTCRTAVGGANALKAIGQGVGGGAGTNTSGFSALLAGDAGSNGYFYHLGFVASFWSSTQYNEVGAHDLVLFRGSDTIYIPPYDAKLLGFSVRCLKDVPNLPPDAPSSPSPESSETNVWTSPTLRWTCSDPDGDPLTYDVYFGMSNPPNTLVSSNQTDTSLTRTGLASGTTYYWKVVAKDSHIHSTTGPVWTFSTQSGGGVPCAGIPTLTYAGKTYHTVQIGSQCWLKENLNVGAMINGAVEQTNNSTIEKYCYVNNPAYCATYGGLYQWNEAMQYDTTAGSRGICPPGWHIPTLTEYQTLSTTVGGDGNALKAIGQGSGGGAGTNTSGFSALLAGWRRFDNSWAELGLYTRVWNSTQYDTASAYYLFLNYNGTIIFLDFYGYSKVFGFSVRCLKD